MLKTENRKLYLIKTMLIFILLFFSKNNIYAWSNEHINIHSEQAEEEKQTGWKKIESKWYYYNHNGEKETGWLKDGKLWYYLEPSTGEMLKNWQKIDDLWYYLDPYKGDMKKGWHKISDLWYYLDPYKGDMKKGWYKISDFWYYLDPYKGDMKTGWVKIEDKWYYLNPYNGRMQTGWNKVDGNWHYLSIGSGVMVKGWQKLGGYWYYLSLAKGIMHTGWIKLDGDLYYLDSPSGKLQIGEFRVGNEIHVSDSKGKWIGSKNDLLRSGIVSKARDYIGGSYVYGSANPKIGFDCSGLVMYVYKNVANINLPHNAQKQATYGNNIEGNFEKYKPGDLLFFGSSLNNITHVGIYDSNGLFVHAASEGRGITTDYITSSWYAKRLVLVKRLIN